MQHDALTARQREILVWVADRVWRGLPPTMREICEHFGFTSTHSASDHLVALEKKGVLQRDPQRARRIRITGRGWHALGRRDVPSHLLSDEELAFLAACGVGR